MTTSFVVPAKIVSEETPVDAGAAQSHVRADQTASKGAP
jgi:hypothetical protein